MTIRRGKVHESSRGMADLSQGAVARAARRGPIVPTSGAVPPFGELESLQCQRARRVA